MIQKIKKPVSILLVFMMIVSLFAMVPVTASAAVGDLVPESEYLTFTAEEAGSSVTLKYTSGTLQYNKNNSVWEDYTKGSQIDLENAGDSVRFCGKDTTFDSANHVSIVGKVACSGNVMSLRLDDNGMDQGLSDSCFYRMFSGCTGLTAAPELPETMLAASCYNSMFSGCTSLTTAPKLPATTLATGCYSYMFDDCERLTTAPELPATTLESGCYGCMFYRCTSLTTAPELPATSLATSCYSEMFSGCTSLTTAPELPATTLVRNCYNRMFYGCSSIKLSETQTAEYSIPYSVPSGGNGTTASNALKNMFAGTGGTFTGTPEINKTYYRPAVKYTVTWKNEDGTTLKTDTVAEGNAPAYTGTTPEKAEDENNTYTFSGWTDGTNTYGATDTLPEVTGDITYTATFTATEKVVEPPTVTYKTATWNGSEVVIDTANTNNYTVVTSEITSWSNGTYVVDADVTITSRIGVGGNVNLILCDDATLTATQGIHVSRGNTLNIFAQSFGDSAGALKVTSGGGPHAGIGSNNNENCGDISINGGNLQVVGGNMSAGIGGGNLKAGGTITINAGDVTATGGHPDNVYGNPHGGAGIGGGSNGSGGAGNVAIHGGHVKATATGNNSPAAIGGGYARGAQGTVTITDGLVVLAGSNASSAKPCFDYPTHRTIYVEIWEHDHSELSYTTSGNVLTAECSGDGCNFINHEISVKLNTPNKSYDETAYSEAYFSSDPVAHNETEEFNAATGLNISLDNIEYYQDGTKLSSAPIEVGNYTAKLTVVVNGSEYTISDDFKILEAHFHDGIYFKFWEKTDSLPTTAGNYYLMSDVTLSGTWNVPSGTTNLCLNGHGILLSRNDVYINVNNANLNVFDCKGSDTAHYITLEGWRGTSVSDIGTESTVDGNGNGTVKISGGYITGGNHITRYAYGGCLQVSANGSFAFNGGTIIGNKSADRGGAIHTDSSSTLTVNGGSIVYNYANWGGAVFNNGTTTINGGSISYNVANSGGGAIELEANTLNVFGGEIKYNRVLNQNGGMWKGGGIHAYASTLNIKGNVIISDNYQGSGAVANNLYLRSNNNIKVTLVGELSESAKIGVSMQSPGTFTNSADTSYNDATKFTADGYAVYKNSDGQLYLHKLSTVTWKNDDGTIIDTTTVANGTTPTHTAPTKAEDAEYTYEFAGWSDGTTTYGASDTLPAVTEDVEYTATYTRKGKYLFAGHSITLGGDIGVNFYIDPAVVDADITGAESAIVKFSFDKHTSIVNLKEIKPDENGWYKATCNIPAAYMAHKIHAEVYINGEKQDETNDYSVQEYAETVLADPSKYDSEKPEALAALVKEMLNYGEKAQTVFSGQMDAAAEYHEIADYTMADVTAEMIQNAIDSNPANDGKTATDMSTVQPEAGAAYYTTSLVFLSRSTLRHYFAIPDGSADPGAYDGNQLNYFYYVEKTDIPAKELDDLQEFTVNGVTFYYSALDYAKAVVESNMADSAKDLAKALYLYNQAANAYFD